MIKIPKELEKVMTDLEAAGFEVYAAGPCVAESLRGESPLDWDMITNASVSDMENILDGGHVYDRRNQIYRIEFEDEEDDGIILDIARYGAGASTAEEELKSRRYTCHAVAVDKRRNVLDPLNGKDDIQKKLCRIYGDAGKFFEESPIRILETVRTASLLGLDLPKSDYEAIVKCRSLLRNVPAEAIRDEFIMIIDSDHAGKGLRMLNGAGLLEYVIGDKLANHPSKREQKDFGILCDGIDKIRHVPERRLGCFYICYDGGKCDEAIRMMHYDEETEQHLLDAIYKMPVIYFIKTKQELKKFIADFGYERYMYLHNLSKAQRIIWDGREDKIVSRNHMWAEIKANGEIVFEEQMPVTRQEILDAGYATEQTIDQMMRQLLDAVFNSRQSEVNHDFVMEKARKFSKSKLKAATRNVKWIK